MALRSLMDTPITLQFLPEIFNSSPMVLASRRRGDDPMPGAPSNRVLSSDTLVTFFPDARSYQVLFTMPLMDGVAPDIKVECPMAVTVGKCLLSASATT